MSKEYLSLQCDSALRNIVRIYPYDVAPNVDTTGDGVADEGSLRGSSEIVAGRIRDEIQQKVADAGLEIIEARITYLAYAPACVRDLEQLYPKNEDIVAEFRYIETQQRVSVPVEELFLDLGQRCKVEDIENFASVLYTAKRSGGDLGNVIQKVARMLGDKIDVKKEIEATLAAKKSEQMIMSLMPAGIILYLQLASPGFLDILYGNPFGICAMTVCLTVYGAAYWMGKRIVEIEV